ncbi:putative Ig domain-containing protein [Plantibacter sp. RU18]|uniref:putative Ig domain-containing protein n=1 Tax=Plantibacter sp. RU18 TaxID=3158143 RepID=UPI003D36D6ED
MSDVTAISAGTFHNLALKADGPVIAWGYDAVELTAVPAAAMSDVTAVAAGLHSLALKADGSVIAWGDNSYGQATVPAAAMSDVTAISAGGGHSLAIRSQPAPAPVFGATSPPALATVSEPYSYTFTASENPTFTVGSGTLPDGLTLSPEGVLSGTPTREDDFTFTAVATGSTRTTAETAPITIKADEVPVFVEDSPPASTSKGVAYAYTFQAVGNSVSYSVTAGTLPAGLKRPEFVGDS